MARVTLQDLVNEMGWDDLPANWHAFDLAGFSQGKRLWGYQQEAVRNALKTLWRYYEDFADYQPNEPPDANEERKRKFFQWYQDNGLKENLDISLARSRNGARLLRDYYEVGQSDRLPYAPFINRACFWMATGSGKTLVIVKLIEVLRELTQRGEIPPNDILVLTHRDDLIAQLKTHVDEFNAAHSDLFIRLRELREYAAVKWENPTLFKEREVTVFYYRSDNLSDEQKEKIVDFRNYDDNGKWFVLLDEAHKGDKEDSKRQHIYSILSRNGFLFNFSATFTDVRDLVTTAYNFNLSEFIKAGYGKHLAILKQEIQAFKHGGQTDSLLYRDDYTDEEKQKIVLKSLIMLAYASKFAEAVRSVQAGLYHKPLLLTLVNSVNVEDSDLKLFFRELERIGKGDLSDAVWQAAKAELWEELRARPARMFEEDGRVEVDEQVFEALTPGDVLGCVFNAQSVGAIEISFRPSDRKQVAFKLATTDRHFALMKTGDMPEWLREELSRFNVNHRFEDEGFFERLNAEDSDITILMGSRAFYEGWDSNRPNVLNFINIGTGTDAKKFILQSVGRGVRIEPLRNRRKRLRHLYNAVPREVDEDLFHQIEGKEEPLETLFIFGTNRHALETVIGELKKESGEEARQQLSLFVNEAAKQRKLLIPTYKEAERPLVESQKEAHFTIAADELDLLKKYVEFIGDDRLLLARYETEPRKIALLRKSLSADEDYFKKNGKPYRNVDLLVRRLLTYFSVVPKEFERLKPLEEEIRHFKHIAVALKDISDVSDLKQKVERVRGYPERRKKLETELSTLGGETKQQVLQLLAREAEETYEHDHRKIRIKHIVNHYYLPVLLSDENERIDYIKHIIQTPSEVAFLNRLEQYVERTDNKFKDFDWWLFSKLDESLDEVYIPYYNPDTNRPSQFKPDFIFWLQKGSDYFIVFVDPHGTKHVEWEWKVNGYRQIFEGEDNRKKNLLHEGLKVGVFVFLYTDDVSEVPEGEKKRYWCDNMDKALGCVLGHA